MILDIRDILQRCEDADELKALRDHIDSRNLIQYLTVSPDKYECHELYDLIYENFTDYMSIDELSNLTDSVDRIYRDIVDKIAQRISTKYAHDSYKFQQWLSPTTIVICALPSKRE